jgi:cell division GTPase FtsZ
MKILVIGLGTAGSRIADQMKAIDKRRHQTHVNAIIVDNDPDILESLKNIDNYGKFYFPKDNLEDPTSLTTDLTIEEVSAKLRSCDKRTFDIILIVCGLGGSLVPLIPTMMTVIEQSFVEPVFGLVLLPEDAATSDQIRSAASQLEMLQNMMHGIILVDNQFWLNKAHIAEPGLVSLRQSRITDQIIHGGAVEVPPFDPYDHVNQAIAKRIMILAQAGDITNPPPETVLDTQEVLQTITGMHYIALGYAEITLAPAKSVMGLEKLPLDKFRQKEISFVAKHERASRMVALAEQAVHRDITVECELSSAKKALVLVIGPEEELSMKGFMAIRKWISESMQGYELRSGDSPTSGDGRECGVLVLFAGIADPPAVIRLKERATSLPSAEPEKIEYENAE